MMQRLSNPEPRAESELMRLRKAALHLARTRKERLSTVHLLAVLADAGGPSTELLSLRGLTAEVVAKAARSFDDDANDPLATTLAEAKTLAARTRRDVLPGAQKDTFDDKLTSHEPNALHVLLALLHDRKSAAVRALIQSGIDLARLRTQAMQRAFGLVAERRPTSAERAPRSPLSPVRPSMTKAVAVPVPLPSPSMRPSTPPTPPPPRKSEPPPDLAKVVPLRPIDGGASHRANRTNPVESLLGKSPTLRELTRNLTEACAKRELGTVVRRDEEIEGILDVLARRSSHAALLIGAPGVGKTSVVHGLVSRLHDDRDPRVVLELRVPELLAGAATRGAIGEKLAEMRSEIEALGRPVLLFVDDLQDLLAAGEEVSIELKSALAKGTLRLIATLGAEALRRVAEQDPVLLRRFSVIELDEPNEEDAFLMLEKVALSLSSHHRVRIAPEVIAKTIAWSVRYVTGKALPEKAAHVLDLAGARAHRRNRSEVALEAVADVLSEMTSVPRERLVESDGERLLRLDETLRERVIGNDGALARIALQLKKSAAGLRGKRPLGSFLLLGPTGVGKTESAKAIARALFGNESAMTRIDLSEYAEQHSIARLIGAPPGYLGHEAGGQLTEAVRKRPYQVVLLDEVEKAHVDVLLAFLPVFDEGHLTDGRGRRVEFANTVFVLTSNLGARDVEDARRGARVGFGGGTAVASESLERVAIGAAKKALPPELYNRIDNVLFFPPLSREIVARIARLQLAELGAALEDRNIALSVDDEAIEVLLTQGGFDPAYGARPMRRAIARLVEGPLSEILLRGEVAAGDTILVQTNEDAIALDVVHGDAD